MIIFLLPCRLLLRYFLFENLMFLIFSPIHLEKTQQSHSLISASQFLSSSQTTGTSSSSQPAHHSTHTEKATNHNASLSQPLSDQFTDLFGTPIQARPSPDPTLSKSKVLINFLRHKYCHLT